MKKFFVFILLAVIMVLPSACGKKNPAGPAAATATSTKGQGTATVTPTRTEAVFYTATGTYTITQTPTASPTAGTHLIISQVYAEGGLDWLAMADDYVEIYNPTYYPVMVSNYTLQFCAGFGTAWQIAANLSGVIQPGSFYLVRMGGDGIGGSPLPYPDAVSDFNLNNFRGKIALVAGSAAMSAGACPSGAYLDLVAYASANCYEGSGPAVLPDMEHSMIRLDNGAQDTDDNLNDFIAINPPYPRNSGNPATLTYSPTGTETPYQTATDTVTQDTPTYTMTITETMTVSPTVSLTEIIEDTGTATVTETETEVPTDTPTPWVVISQVYGGGGQAGAAFTNDFVELFNKSGYLVDLTGWSLQYASAAGTTWASAKVSLTGTISPYAYFLVQLASSGPVGAAMPQADTIGTLNMSATAGKVALVRTATGLPAVSCPLPDPDIADLVGYGATASCYEGAGNAPAPSSSTADFRAAGGCQDTDSNSSDFSTAAPSPKNSQTLHIGCP